MAGKWGNHVVPISGKNHKIHSRIGHITVQYSNFIVVWGGYEDPLEANQPPHLRRARYHPPEELLLYDTEYEIWHLVRTRGVIPPKLCGSTAAVCGDHLFLYGGFCEELEDEDGGNMDRLYRLDLRRMEWRLLHPAGLRPLACDKLVSWSTEDAVYIFGGFGPRPPDPLYTANGVEFIVDLRSGDLRGWIGQLVRYCPSRHRWEWPTTSGEGPCPRAAHAAARVGDAVYVFGGRMDRRLNDLYRLDLSAMQWQRLRPSDPESAVPQSRSWHSLTPLNPRRLLLYGGFNNYSEALGDPWEYHIPSGRWSPAPGFAPSAAIRMWHAAAAAGPGEVLIVGGIQSSILGVPPAAYATEVVTVRRTPRSLLRLSLEVVERHWPVLESAVWLLPAGLLERVHARLAGRTPLPAR